MNDKCDYYKTYRLSKSHDVHSANIDLVYSIPVHCTNKPTGIP